MKFTISKKMAPLAIVAFCIVNAAILGGGCSVLNRHGPDVTCADLQDGGINACADGIIASCIEGEVRYQVCEDGYEDVSARDLCEGGWQTKGAFTCSPDGGTGSGPPRLEIASVEVVGDDNQDGILSPGESGRVLIYAKNPGDAELEGVTASLTKWREDLVLTGCTARGTSGSSRACTAGCDCTGVADQGKQTLNSGQTGYYAILDVDLQVAAAATLAPATFEVQFQDAGGQTWSDSFTLDILDPAANIGVGSAEIVGDDNEDGFLSPGENARLRIYGQNAGASQALGLSASLSAFDPNIVVTSCTARGTSGSSRSCTAACDCTGVADQGKQQLDPGQTGYYAILEVDFTVSEAAPLAPLSFPIQFEDEWGNSWSETVSPEVSATGANIQIATAEVYGDDNDDGQLSPGESAHIRIYAENIGSSNGLDLTASLSGWSQDVVVTDCTARGTSGSSRSCTSACDCTGVADQGKQDLNPAQTGYYAILDFDVDVSLSAALAPLTFNVEFEDGWGNKWTDTYQVNVVGTGANIGVGSTTLINVTGSDSQLSPGESATIRVYAQNTGTSNGLDLTGSVLSAPTHVTINGCTARGTSGSSGSCNSPCTCTNVSSNAMQDLNTGATGFYSIVDIQISLSAAAPVSPITFNIQFQDGWTNTWNRTFQIGVAAP